LVLESRQFAGTPLAETLVRHFPAGRMSVQAAQLSETAAGCRAIGRLAWLSLPSQPVAIDFFETGARIDMRLSTTRMKSTWRMGDSFARLKGTLLDRVGFRLPKLILDSRENDALPADFQVRLGHPPFPPGLLLKQGLSFEGELDLGLFRFAAWLFEGAKLRVSGPLETLDGAARMWLKAPVGEPLAVGPLRMPLELQLVSYFEPALRPSQPPIPRAYIRLAADLSLDAGGEPVRAPLAVRLDSEDLDLITLEAGLEALSIRGLAKIGALLDGSPLQALMPNEFPGLDGLALERLRATLSLPGRSLAGLGVDVRVDRDWRFFDMFTLRNLKLRFDLSQPASRHFRRVSARVSAETDLGGAALKGHVQLPQLEYQFEMPPGKGFSLSQALEALGAPFEDLPDLRCETFALFGAARRGAFGALTHLQGDWSIAIGIAHLSVREILLRIEREARGGKSGVLSGQVDIGGMRMRVDWRLPGGPVLQARQEVLDLANLLDALGGRRLFDGLPVPREAFQIELREAVCALDVSARSFTASAVFQDWGQVDVSLRKAGSGWGFGLGIRLAESFRFSNLAPALGVLDGLRFANGYLLISSFGFRDLALPNQPAQSVQRVEKGLNIFLPIHLEGGGAMGFLKQMLGGQSPELALRGSFNSARHLLLEAAMSGFQIAPGVAFSQAGLRLGLEGDGDLSLAVFGALQVALRDRLNFTGEMTVEPNGAYFSATMEGVWREPFGMKGVTVRNLAMQLGINAQLIPAIGFAGSARIGGLSGTIALLFNAVDPAESVLQLQFAVLTFKSMLNVLQQRLTQRTPRWMHRYFDDGFRDVDIYLVPETTRIGQLTFEQGFRFQGRFKIADLQGEIKTSLDFVKGLQANGRLQPLRFGKTGRSWIFQANASENPRKGPSFGMEIGMARAPFFRLSASVNLMQFIKRSILISLGENGFAFKLHERTAAHSLDVGCVIDKAGFSFQGRMALGLNASFTVREPRSGVILGKVSLKTGLSGRIQCQAGNRLMMQIQGQFRWRAYYLNLPQVQLRTVPATMPQLASQAGKEIANRAGSIFSQAFGGLGDWGKAIKSGALISVGGVKNAAKVANKAFGAGLDQAASQLKYVGYGANEMASSLSKEFAVSSDRALTSLNRAGFSDRAVAGAMKNSFNYSANRAASYFNSLGRGPAQIALVLKKGLGASNKDIAKGLKKVGYGAKTIGTALNSGAGASTQAVANALRDAGYSAKTVGSVLKSGFNKSRSDIDRMLKRSGFSGSDILKALMDLFTGWF